MTLLQDYPAAHSIGCSFWHKLHACKWIQLMCKARSHRLRQTCMAVASMWLASSQDPLCPAQGTAAAYKDSGWLTHPADSSTQCRRTNWLTYPTDSSAQCRLTDLFWQDRQQRPQHVQAREGGQGRQRLQDSAQQLRDGLLAGHPGRGQGRHGGGRCLGPAATLLAPPPCSCCLAHHCHHLQHRGGCLSHAPQKCFSILSLATAGSVQLPSQHWHSTMRL